MMDDLFSEIQTAQGIILSPGISVQDLVEDIKTLVASMYAFVEENVRVTCRGRPRIELINLNSL